MTKYTNKQFEDLLALKQEYKDNKALIEVRLSGIEAQLLEALEERGGKHEYVGADGKRYSAAKTQAHTVTFDEKALRRSLGVRRFIDLCTSPKLDKGKIEEAVKAGKIKKDTVVKYSKLKPSAAYAKVSELKKTETNELTDAL